MYVFTLPIQFVVVVHNPIGRPILEMVHFPVYDVNFEVLAFALDPVPSQVVGITLTGTPLISTSLKGYLSQQGAFFPSQCAMYFNS